MTEFKVLQSQAEARKGGPAALAALMPAVKSPAELKRIPDDRWLSGMTRRIFQAGFRWKVIDDKWDGFEAAFGGFDPARLSLWSDEDTDRLLKDPRIVRNGQKIATVGHNAALLVDLALQYGSAAACFADWPNDDFVGLLELLKTCGARLGGRSGQIFLRFMGRDGFILSTDVSAALIAAGVVDKEPTSKSAMAAVQAAFNGWAAESGLPLAHISKTLACSIGD